MFARLVISLNTFAAILWTCFVIIPVAINYDSSDIVSAMYRDDEDDDTFTVRNLFDGRVGINLCHVVYQEAGIAIACTIHNAINHTRNLSVLL